MRVEFLLASLGRTWSSPLQKIGVGANSMFALASRTIGTYHGH